MQKLFDLFEEMGYKMAEGFFRQGSLAEKDYPAEFFTFWNFDTPYLRHSDNYSKEHALFIQVGFYTSNPAKIYTKKDKDGSIITLSPIDDFCKRAKLKGWIVEGEPTDADADNDNFYGRVCNIIIKEKSED